MKTLKTIITITILTLFSISCSSDDDSKPEIKEDLSYSNGNLSTGNISVIDQVAAPAGYTWSQIQIGNESQGFSANGDYFLADDFTVPAGEKWNINKINFYIYKTNYIGEDSPVNTIRYEIYSTNPSLEGAKKVYGDFSTNKYSTGIDSKMYRISNVPGSSVTTRKIFKITASAADLELPSGTYWIKWQTATTDSSSHFHPSVTVVGSLDLPTYNSLQQNAGVWASLLDKSGSKIDFPFEIVGTKNKI